MGLVTGQAVKKGGDRAYFIVVQDTLDPPAEKKGGGELGASGPAYPFVFLQCLSAQGALGIEPAHRVLS